MHPTEATEQERQRRLHGLTAELSETVSAHEIAGVLSDVGAMLLGAAQVRLWTADTDSARLVDVDAPASVALTEREHPIVDAMSTTESLWLTRDLPPELLAAEPVRAACVIPLIVDGAVIGAVDFAFAEMRSFGDEEREFLMGIAGEVALALDRTRLPVIHEWPTGSARIDTVASADALRVMIVDDQAEDAEELRDALEALGHEAVIVFNGQAAVNAAVEFHAHVAFVELDMPTGYELVARLCKMPHWERTRFVPIRRPFDLDALDALLR